MNTLGERVRVARKYAKLSQTQLAKAIGVRQPTIADLESGESQGTKYLLQIAIVCGVRPVWLTFGIGPMVEKAA